MLRVLALNDSPGIYVKLGDFLAKNLRAQDRAPHLFGWKISHCPTSYTLTWTQAFPTYVWIFCTSHPTCWQDLRQYNLLILQTAWQLPVLVWQGYNTAFKKGELGLIKLPYPVPWSRSLIFTYFIATTRYAKALDGDCSLLSRGMMVLVVGSSAGAAMTTFVKAVMVNTLR